MMKRKILLSIILAVLISPVLLVSAAGPIPSPDNDNAYFVSVDAYQGVLETGDQLYLIYYNIEYVTNPDEAANEAWIFRLVSNTDNTTYVGNVPYAYQDDGYGFGLVSLYLSAADAPTWGGDYSAIIEGNPVLNWAAGLQPLAITNRASFNENTFVTLADTQDEITARVEIIALELEAAWGASYDLIEVTESGDTKLTSQGQTYFSRVINNLVNISPGLFPGTSVIPDFEERIYTRAYSDNLSIQLIGTTSDFTSLASDFGTDRMWMSGLFWVIAVIYIIYRAVRKTGDYRHAFLLFLLFLPFGARLGYIPLVVPVVAMILMGAVPMTWYLAHRNTGV